MFTSSVEYQFYENSLRPYKLQLYVYIFYASIIILYTDLYYQSNYVVV